MTVLEIAIESLEAVKHGPAWAYQHEGQWFPVSIEDLRDLGERLKRGAANAYRDWVESL